MKKIVICFITFLVIFPFVNSEDNKNLEISDENIIFVINELNRIKEGGITVEETQHFIEFLQDKFGKSNIYVNVMCKVTGIGMGLLIPPFIPITPILFAAVGILLDTDGLMGHWTHMVHLAIFIPFIGLPLYFAPPALFLITGFAGIVIGVAIFK